MTTGNALKLLLTFMIPLIIGNVFQQIYSISDIIIVGRTIGINALAAVGAAAPVFMLLVMVTMGLTNGFTVLTGQFFGAGDLQKMRRSVAVSMLLSVTAVLFMAVAMHLFVDPLLRLMNLPTVLYQDCRSYIVIVADGLWAMMAYNFFAAVLRALGDSKTPVYFLILATVLNVGLALLFILKFAMGVPGSAYALVIAQGIAAILSAVYMWQRFPILRLRKEDWHWEKSFAIEHLKIGVPMAAQFSVIGMGILLIQSVTNKFGPDTIAGFTAAMRVEQLALQPMASFGIFIFFFSEGIIGIFIDGENEKVVGDALNYLHHTVPFYFFLSQIFIYRSAVQGMGVGMVPLTAAIIELGMRTGAAEILAVDWGYLGVCYASPIAWVASSVFLFFAFHYFLRSFAQQ